MPNSNQLEVMSNQDIETINRDCLVDISTIEIKKELSSEEKILFYIEQVKNPYCFLCGKTPVKICFTDLGEDLGVLLTTFFIRLKQG